MFSRYSIASRLFTQPSTNCYDVCKSQFERMDRLEIKWTDPKYSQMFIPDESAFSNAESSSRSRRHQAWSMASVELRDDEELLKMVTWIMTWLFGHSGSCVPPC